jgi:hypothetical protein
VRPLRIEHRKDVEEVPADLTGREILARDLPALELGGREEDEAPLDALRDPQLLLDPPAAPGPVDGLDEERLDGLAQ